MLERMHTAKNLQKISTLVTKYVEKNNIAILNVKEAPITYQPIEESESKLRTNEIFSFAVATISLRFRRVKVD